MSLKTKTPTVAAVLGSLTTEQLERVQVYAQQKEFHHGFYWHGPEGELGIASEDKRFNSLDCACPMAVAFEVEPDRSNTSFWGAKMDDKLFAAMKHFVTYAGSEKGMITYLNELATLESAEIKEFIEQCLAEHS